MSICLRTFGGERLEAGETRGFQHATWITKDYLHGIAPWRISETNGWLLYGGFLWVYLGWIFCYQSNQPKIRPFGRYPKLSFMLCLSLFSWENQGVYWGVLSAGNHPFLALPGASSLQQVETQLQCGSLPGRISQSPIG